MRFRIFDHRVGEPLGEDDSFDRVVARARRMAHDEPGRHLEIQRRVEDDGPVWAPTGWTFGVQGQWE